MASMTVCPVSVHANYVSEGSVSIQQKKMEDRWIEFVGKKLVKQISDRIDSYIVSFKCYNFKCCSQRIDRSGNI